MNTFLFINMCTQHSSDYVVVILLHSITFALYVWTNIHHSLAQQGQTTLTHLFQSSTKHHQSHHFFLNVLFITRRVTPQFFRIRLH